MYELKVTFII